MSELAPHDAASRHATLRFVAGPTAAFVLCEVMQWGPTFLAPVLTAVLLANLPVRPPLKMGVVLIAVMAAAALFTYALSALFRGTPFVLFGLLALCIFVSFRSLLGGKQALPFVLFLLCLTTIPVIVMIAPAHAGAFPEALIRSMALAMLAVWASYVFWPTPPAPKADPGTKPSLDPGTIRTLALLGTAVLVPLMLVYLLFGPADALPVLVTTMMIVINFDPQRGRQQAQGLILGNFAGGLLGFLLHVALLATPTLPVLALLLFIALLWFAPRITDGGPASAVALVACNAMLIVLSSSIASGPGSLSVWLTRLFQFALAGVFAVSMMNLVWRLAPRRSATTTPASA